MKGWPNIGDRIRQRLQDLGFQRNGRPDVMRFAVERGYIHVYLYRWIGGATPDYDNIIRLAGDLEVSPSWLMFGEAGMHIPARRVAAPIGRRASGPAGVGATPEPLAVVGRRPRTRHNTGRNASYQHLGIHPLGPSRALPRAA